MATHYTPDKFGVLDRQRLESFIRKFYLYIRVPGESKRFKLYVDSHLFELKRAVTSNYDMFMFFFEAKKAVSEGCVSLIESLEQWNVELDRNKRGARNLRYLKQEGYTWGPIYWKFLHTLALAHKPEASLELMGFFRILHKLLPCPKCASHCSEYMSTNNKSLVKAARSGPSIFEFSVDFHNAVNDRLNKPEVPLARAANIYGRVWISA